MEHSSVGRAATAEDIAAVTASLTGAFFDDPLWGWWTFLTRQVVVSPCTS